MVATASAVCPLCDSWWVEGSKVKIEAQIRSNHQIFSSALLEQPGTLSMSMEGSPVKGRSASLVADVEIRPLFQKLLNAL